VKKSTKEEFVHRKISKWLEEPIESEYILRIFFKEAEDEPTL
jgi:hypothetical protein